MNYKTPLDSLKNRAVKRVFDIVVSVPALIGIVMLMPYIAYRIKRESRGPVIFRQLRTGKEGREFYCYKFRSMHPNSESDTRQATKDDARLFPFGAVMRHHNIDELPQFWNVLKGDMSVVGPRPHMVYHTKQYAPLIDKYMLRHTVKPGITGWAQVTGFCGETKELDEMKERVRRDLWYIDHWSLKYDASIVWRTVKNILNKKIMTY